LWFLLGCTSLPFASTDVQIRFDDAPQESVRTALPEGVDAFDGAARRIYLHASRNETLAFTCSLRGGGRLDVRVDDLMNENGAVLKNPAAIFRRQAVEVTDWPGWNIRSVAPSQRVARRADVLVPRDAPKGGLPAGAGGREPLEIWVDLNVPADAEPGTYHGRLTVLADGRQADAFDIELVVWPLTLAADAGVALLGNVDQRLLFAHHVRSGGQPYGPARVLSDDPAREELARVLGSTVKFLHDHRVTAQMRTLYPLVRVTADQGMTVDWSDYVRTIGGFLDGSALGGHPLAMWPVPFDESFPEPPGYGALESPTYSRLLHDYFASAAQCYTEQGWIERAVVLMPYAKPPGPAASKAIAHFGYIVRAANSTWRIAAPIFPQDMAAFGWHGYQHEDVRSFVDYWAPPAQFFDRNAISAAGGKSWLVVDRPSFSGTAALAGSALDARVLAWQADAGGVAAIDLGTINAWPKAQGGALAPQACVDADPRVLMYPGGAFGLKEPVASVRLKDLRRGMQDMAYLAQLRACGQEHIAVSLRQALLSHFGVQAYGPHCADGRPDGWLEDGAWWELARRIMADELLKAGSVPPGGSSAIGLETADLRWRRFMEGTRQVRVQPIGTRIRFVGVHPEEGLSVECAVAVSNRQRAPLTGTLGFDQLPVSWTAAAASRRIEDMPPGAHRGVVLSAEVAALASEPNGLLMLPLVFEEDGADRRTISARVAQVVAATLAPAPKLDGDLNDWPVGAGNCATDFAVLSGGENEGRPTHETLCYVGRVADKLYIGLRCPMGTESGETLQTSDIVPDDGVLRGADAVEILLDPANAGTRSPSDLYRLVVRTGGVRAEWGVTTYPPTGPSRSWAPDIRHAVRVRGGVWSAEIEIPLAAFPENYRTQSIWGFNVVRYDAAAQESSNWSGAVSNVYDPLSLGNLLLP
jgi:hypothetical protein